MFLSKNIFFILLFLNSNLLCASASYLPRPHPRKTCVVRQHAQDKDDAPAILNAFKECGNGGNVVFLNQTYNINSVMNTTGLQDCEIDLHGTLLVSS